jgi:CRISPR type I-E-associated protein CasB/Cse2
MSQSQLGTKWSVASLVAFRTGTASARVRSLNCGGSILRGALHRLLTNVPESWLSGDGLRRWALIVHTMALAAPDALKTTTRFGSALLAAGFKEGRFVNLLDATSDELLTALPRAVRFLVAKGQSLNAFALADLVLSAGRGDGAGWAETVRQRVAQDYYRAEARAELSETAKAPGISSHA